MKRIFFISLFILFSGCATKEYHSYVISSPGIKKPTQKPYVVNGNIYYPYQKVPIGWTQRGIASWYGPNFHGKYTSNGEIYNMFAYTAAHKTLPMNTIVKVTNLNNGKSVFVRINDRGPFVKGRIIDLSYAAGKKLGLDITGTAPVVIKVVRFKGKSYVSGYKIQTGAFINKQGALNTAKKYKKFGYNTEVVRVGNFYKVYITGFKTYNEAKRFELENHIAGFIVGD